MRAMANAVLTTAFMFAPTAIQAAVMDFSTLPAGVTTAPTYSQNGITAFSVGDFVNSPSGSLHLDSSGVPENNSSYSFALSSAAPFAASSFDISSGCGSCGFAAGFSRATGYDAANMAIFQTLFDASQVTTISFTGWTGLSRLTIEALGDTDDHFSIDNVVLTPVPEPASWAMMILGFGLVGAATRKRAHPRHCAA